MDQSWFINKQMRHLQINCNRINVFRTYLATLQILCFVFISVKEKGEMYERNDEEERGIYVVKCERNPKAKNKTIKTTKLSYGFT